MSGGPSISAARTRWLLVALLLSVVTLHVYVVWTIAAQPLGILRKPPSQRSAIWNLHNDTVHRKGPGADLFAVYHAGVALDQGLDPYGLDENPRRTPYFFAFRYLPVVGQTLGFALSTLPPRAAYLLWVAILEATLAGLIAAIFRRARDPGLSVLATCILLVSSPYFLEVHMGQFTFVTLGLVALAVLLPQPTGARRIGKGTLRGAACYTAAVLLKVFPLVAAPALLRRMPQRLILAIAVVTAVAVSAPYFLARPHEWGIFYQTNVGAPSGGGDAGNYGLVYLMARIVDDLGQPWLAERSRVLITGWRILMLSASALLVWLSREGRIGLGVATMLLAHFASYPHVWEHHMSGVIVTGILVLLTVWHDRGPTCRVARGVIIAALILLALPTPFALFDVDKNPAVWDPSATWPAWQRYVLPLSKALPTAALLGICLWLLGRAGWRGVDGTAEAAYAPSEGETGRGGQGDQGRRGVASRAVA